MTGRTVFVSITVKTDKFDLRREHWVFRTSKTNPSNVSFSNLYQGAFYFAGKAMNKKTCKLI